MITRKQYMQNANELHHQYYMQFINKDLMQFVVNAIGVDRIMQSTDKHMNDIPLKYWDNLMFGIPQTCNRAMIVECKEMWSLNTSVCIAKAAAKQFKMQNEGHTNV